MRRLSLVLLAPLAFVLPSPPASAEPLCVGVTVVAVSTTTVRDCVRWNGPVPWRSDTGATGGVSVSVERCVPRRYANPRRRGASQGVGCPA